MLRKLAVYFKSLRISISWFVIQNLDIWIWVSGFASQSCGLRISISVIGSKYYDQWVWVSGFGSWSLGDWVWVSAFVSLLLSLRI